MTVRASTKLLLARGSAGDWVAAAFTGRSNFPSPLFFSPFFFSFFPFFFRYGPDRRCPRLEKNENGELGLLRRRRQPATPRGPSSPLPFFSLGNGLRARRPHKTPPPPPKGKRRTPLFPFPPLFFLFPFFFLGPSATIRLRPQKFNQKNRMDGFDIETGRGSSATRGPSPHPSPPFLSPFFFFFLRA